MNDSINMKYTYSTVIPLQLQVWLATDTYEKSDDPKEISVTGLLKPTKSIILTQRVQDKTQEAIANGEFSLLKELNKPDLQGFVKSRMGTSIHDSVESAWKNNYRQALTDLGYQDKFIDRIVINPESSQELPEDAIVVYTEKRLKRQINGYTISGELDFCFKGVIQDLKTTSTFAFKYRDDEKHGLQMSIYKWIFEGNGIELEPFGQINYLFTDWSEVQAARDMSYPQANALGVEIPLQTSQEVENFISNKIHMIETGMDLDEDFLPRCTPEELWQTASDWAYYVNPAKAQDPTARATKKFDNLAEANRWLAGKGKGIVIERPGKVKYCNFCIGAALCKQKDELIAAGLLDYAP